MPIKIQSDLPARTVLENENIFVMTENRAATQDIRPLKIAIVNLMPTKETTETQLLRLLGNTPLQIDISLVRMENHAASHVSLEHLEKFYIPSSDIFKNKYDGLIITGAPVEQMPFEDVDYWNELCDIMDYAKKNVFSTLYICWGAQAGLYHKYGIDKHMLDKKLSGIYRHHVINRKHPLMRGFDDYFMAPHSRYTAVSREDIEKCPELEILADSEEAGVYIVMSRNGKNLFVMGHPEYDRITLDQEYKRDMAKGISPDMPVNYYPDDDYTKRPDLSWRAHANILYSNWLNYFVYQTTPYDLNGAPIK